MNPGPWGMAQTGVPFGEIGLVRELAGDRRRGRQAAGGAPETPDRGVRVHAERGQRPASLGLGQGTLRLPGALLRALLRLELLPAGVHGGERPQPDPGQAAGGGAGAALRRLRRGAPARRRHARARVGRGGRQGSPRRAPPRRWPSGSRPAPGPASAASSTPARRARRRTGDGPRRRSASSGPSASTCRRAEPRRRPARGLPAVRAPAPGMRQFRPPRTYRLPWRST